MKNIFNKYKLLILVVVLILIGIYIFSNYIFDYSKIEDVDLDEKLIIKDTKDIIEDTYYIDIKGEVSNPGVYEISSNSRLIDVVEVAGGLTDNADISLLNLSKKVTDEMSIRIYSKREVSDAINKLVEEPKVIEVIKEIEKECICPSINNDACINNVIENETDDTNKLININTATVDELMNIPGIGKSKAVSIIEYRKDNVFTKIDDIKNVSGIGVSIFESIKNYITI